VLFGDISPNTIFSSSMQIARRLARLGIVAMGALQHQAPGGGWIGNVASCRLVQNVYQTVSHRTIATQQRRKGDRAGVVITLKDAGIEPEFTAKGRIETGRIDTERFCQVRNTDRVIPAGMKEILCSFNGLLRIKPTRPPWGTAIFCSDHYITP